MLFRSPPEIFDTTSLARLCTQSSLAGEALWKAEVGGMALTGLVAPSAPENTAHLSELVDEIIAIQYRSNRLSRWEDVLREVVEPPVVESSEGLARLLADLRGQVARQGEAQAAETDLKGRLQTVEEDIAKCVETLGCCPTCGGDLKTEALLDRRCRHDS